MKCDAVASRSQGGHAALRYPARRAMFEASPGHVHMDEMMLGIGTQLGNDRRGVGHRHWWRCFRLRADQLPSAGADARR